MAILADIEFGEAGVVAILVIVAVAVKHQHGVGVLLDLARNARRDRRWLARGDFLVFFLASLAGARHRSFVMSMRRTYPPTDGTADYLVHGLSVSTIADAIVAGAEAELHQGVSPRLVQIGLSQSRDVWRKKLDSEDFQRLGSLVRKRLRKHPNGSQLADIW